MIILDQGFNVRKSLRIVLTVDPPFFLMSHS
jgi:hypothetical protein